MCQSDFSLLFVLLPSIPTFYTPGWDCAPTQNTFCKKASSGMSIHILLHRLQEHIGTEASYMQNGSISIQYILLSKIHENVVPFHRHLRFQEVYTHECYQIGSWLGGNIELHPGINPYSGFTKEGNYQSPLRLHPLRQNQVHYYSVLPNLRNPRLKLCNSALLNGLHFWTFSSLAQCNVS